MRYTFLSLMIGCLLASCNVKPDKQTAYYYNLDSLLKAQQVMLVNRNAQIQKKAVLDGDSATTLVKADSAAWSNEFEIFGDLDINKPTLQGLYSIENGTDHQSNLKVKNFKTDSDDAQVKEVKIYYLDKIDNLRKVEAYYQEKNPVYNSFKNVKFIFDDIKGESVLTSYEVNGAQKVVLKDTISLNIKSKILL